MFLKSLLSFLLIYEVTDNKYNLPHQKLLGPGLQCSERKNALNSDADAPRPLQMRPSSHQQTDTQRPVLPSPEFPKQGPCEGSSPYFCWRMAAVPSRALGRKWRAVRSLNSQSPEPTSLVIRDLYKLFVHQTLEESL